MELRFPDGSADIYTLFAGLVVAAEHGLVMDNALEKADSLYVSYNIFRDQGFAEKLNLESLPASCYESAESLLDKRHYFEKDGIFPAGVIDNITARLKAYNDRDLSEKLYNKTEEISKLVRQYLHCS